MLMSLLANHRRLSSLRMRVGSMCLNIWFNIYIYYKHLHFEKNITLQVEVEISTKCDDVYNIF